MPVPRIQVHDTCHFDGSRGDGRDNDIRPQMFLVKNDGDDIPVIATSPPCPACGFSARQTAPYTFLKTEGTELADSLGRRARLGSGSKSEHVQIQLLGRSCYLLGSTSVSYKV